MNFHHFGIITSNIKSTSKNLKRVLPIKNESKVIVDKKWRVKIIFLLDNQNIKYEIIEPIGKKSPIYNALSKNINILNHIAYKTENFDRECEYLVNEGLFPITKPMSAVAFNNKKVTFFFTKEKFILEIIES